MNHPYSRFKRVVALDLETHIIQSGLLAPPIVCGAFSEVDNTGSIRGELLTRDASVQRARELLLDDSVLLTNANIAFDFGCFAATAPDLLKLIFRAYKSGRVVDILVVQALHAIANGHLFLEKNGLPMLSSRGTRTERYSLDIVVRQELGRTDAKANDFWKMRYALLEPLAIELWPEEARQYPIDDACNALEVTLKMLGHRTGSPPHDNLADAPAQSETDWALHLGAMWGLRADESRIEVLEARAEELHAQYIKRFSEHGFFRKPRQRYVDAGRVDPDAGTRDTCAVAQAVARAYGAVGTCDVCRGTGHVPVNCRGAKHKNRYQGCLSASCSVCGGLGHIFQQEGPICKACAGSGYSDTSMVPKSDGGGISASRDTLMESGDEDLVDFGENKQEKVLTTYLPFLRRGLRAPITLEPNVLVESGRTSYRDVIQLFPRGSMGVTSDGRWVPTLRECFAARPSRVYGSSDYPAGELCTLAQVCLWVVGYSRMAEIINETRKPGKLHTTFASRMIGVTPAELEARVDAGNKTAKGYRQAAKPCNFGFPGGMGAATVVLTNRKESVGSTQGRSGRVYPGIRFCILVGGNHECGHTKVREWGRPGYERELVPTCKRCLEVVEHDLKPLWFETFPEVKEYHRWVKREMDASNDVLPAFGPWFPERRAPHRVRQVERFPSGANNGFQAYIADITKDALRRVVTESYTDESSALYKAATRTISMQHDELFTEMDEQLAHLAGPRVAELMKQAYDDWVPDVHIDGVDTALMRFWNKDAEAVFDSSGKLSVWEPKLKQ